MEVALELAPRLRELFVRAWMVFVTKIARKKTVGTGGDDIDGEKETEVVESGDNLGVYYKTVETEGVESDDYDEAEMPHIDHPTLHPPSKSKGRMIG